ncbi:hypothetical protein ACH5RR_041184 [Cinchona calisaya]|uniref:Reverse transcriptase Ty1/copia-type domain-containing protein n=1 Tax=Cinchona calisaya TaxID=153742 RepID=A0ABD2XY29_9GENT
MKYKSNEEVEKFKVRFVAKRYKQKSGINYFEIFALVIRFNAVRLIISFVTRNKWRIYQIDVKSIFFFGVLEEEVYVKQLAGFVRKCEENKVHRLKRVLLV